MIKLNVWQECFVKKLKKLKETKKIVFKNEGNHTDIKIIVEEASAQLTFEYSKIINKFMEENPKIKIIFCVLSLKTYIENDSEVVVDC